MSECIICKGNNQLSTLGFFIGDADEFLMKGAFWLGGASDIWTFRYKGKEIDSIITDAYSQIHNGVRYQDTQVYELLNCLMDNNISFAMWYDIYAEELDLCSTRDEVLETCYKQMMDESGMCEVYLVWNAVKR